MADGLSMLFLVLARCLDFVKGTFFFWPRTLERCFWNQLSLPRNKLLKGPEALTTRKTRAACGGQASRCASLTTASTAALRACVTRAACWETLHSWALIKCNRVPYGVRSAWHHLFHRNRKPQPILKMPSPEQQPRKGEPQQSSLSLGKDKIRGSLSLHILASFLCSS